MANPLSSHNFGWDAASGRYYDLATHRFVSSGVVHRAIEEAILASQNSMAAVTQSLVSGSIGLPQWQLAMEAEIKLIHTASAALARGGWGQMTQSDWGWVGQRVKTQYQYLRNFANQIADGSQSLNGKAVFRARMYAQASRNIYEEMRRRFMRLYKGAVSERRILDPVADHCEPGDRPGCVELAAKGVQPIGTLPEIGDAQCLTMCRCKFMFYDTEGKVIGE